MAAPAGSPKLGDVIDAMTGIKGTSKEHRETVKMILKNEVETGACDGSAAGDDLDGFINDKLGL